MQMELPIEISSLICMEASRISFRVCNKFFYNLMDKLYSKKFSPIRKIAVTFHLIKSLRVCNKYYNLLLSDLYFKYCYFNEKKPSLTLH